MKSLLPLSGSLMLHRQVTMMRYFALLLFAGILLGCNHTSESRQDGAATAEKRWLTTLSDGRRRAEAEAKPLIVMISEPDCRWCIKMKETTLRDRRVQKLLEGFVRVKIRRSDRVQSGEIKAFDGKIPGFFVMTPRGEVVESIVGYYRADDFFRYLQEAESEVREEMK